MASHREASIAFFSWFSVEAEGVEESFSQFPESWANSGGSSRQIRHPGGKLSNPQKLAELIGEVRAVLVDQVILPTTPSLGHVGKEHLHFEGGEVRVPHVNRFSV